MLDSAYSTNTSSSFRAVFTTRRYWGDRGVLKGWDQRSSLYSPGLQTSSSNPGVQGLPPIHSQQSHVQLPLCSMRRGEGRSQHTVLWVPARPLLGQDQASKLCCTENKLNGLVPAGAEAALRPISASNPCCASVRPGSSAKRTAGASLVHGPPWPAAGHTLLLQSQTPLAEGNGGVSTASGSMRKAPKGNCVGRITPLHCFR